MRPYEQHRNCPLDAMTYDARGATCSACGLRWSLDPRFGYRLVSRRPAWAAS